jgi:translation initiation factor IF-3
MGKIREFLGEANKARVTVMFRGREITHRELGHKVLERVIGDLKEAAVIESAPRMEGRLLYMILAPNPKMLQAQRSRAQAAQAAPAAAGGEVPPPRAEAAPAAAAPAAGPTGGAR